jgi:UTP--glucose-1-phosphate uridylyltransferase
MTMKSHQTVRKAIFPVAGLGTRFLPATKAMPKEMLTIVDKPLIQLAVDEAREAGIEHFIFVTGRNKSMIEDHFDRSYELEAVLKKKGRLNDLAALESGLPKAGRTSFTRQQEPLGLGHAIWCARDIVGNEPFAVLLPDMAMRSSPGCLLQMCNLFARRGGNVLAVEEVPKEQVSRYGVVGVKDRIGRAFTIDSMIEKPAPDAAPSNLIISGRYILQPDIFSEIEKVKPGAGGEIQITDAMIGLLSRQTFNGLIYDGKTYDCGDKIGFLAANLAYGLTHENLGPAVRQALTAVIADLGGEVSWKDQERSTSSSVAA